MMNDYRAAILTMQDDEVRLLMLLETEAKTRVGHTRTVLILGTMFGLLIAAAASNKILSDNVRRQTAEDALFVEKERAAETLLKNADTAMYHAKQGGRNNFKFFKAEMNLRAVERQSLEVSLRRALERKEFVLHYQPKINLATEEITGVEALIRWQQPDRGLIPPSQFIPVAEDCGLIHQIGSWGNARSLHASSRMAGGGTTPPDYRRQCFGPRIPNMSKVFGRSSPKLA